MIVVYSSFTPLNIVYSSFTPIVYSLFTLLDYCLLLVYPLLFTPCLPSLIIVYTLVAQTVLHKSKEKAQHDKSFTEDVIQKMFCNIEEIHHLHQSLLRDLTRLEEGGVTHLSCVAKVYARYVSGGRGLTGGVVSI